ncbi:MULTISPECIES: DNA-binding response regulator [Sphingobium]|uniref:Response regulator transcription factor n=1 Tax=Sphingobium cupriresistens TaxID=1132417 RepID=A0A8G1ZQI4_9SPHN|nr:MULTISPECIES: DNA-binding response regulator [Sphingobium]MBJ7375404.1 response regulator [Sphingobium sp.]MBJ7375421.1 response regulator [Sphingobium sp.]RYM14925.1 response regulator transcription factor [Sphingobium cupriresistens]WCP14429.1 Protein-glutamate methylesterase/protein-glutamine glutaminase [Sphingobium sp. AntQ-1]
MTTPSHTDTVLVVDDTPESLRFLTDTLEAANISVLIATSGDAAIELLDHVAPDLILMDAVMPGLDGFETTRAIKQMPAGAPIPIIFMTGLTESEHVVHALEAGGVDYVRKPIVVEELLARVRVHMANARQTQGGQFALDATGRNLIAVATDGRLSWSTPGAEKLMEALAPGWSRGDAAPPALLRNAVGRLLADDLAPGATAKADSGQGDTVELIIVGRPRRDEILIRLNHIDPQADIGRLQSHFSLTQREAEVLLWISYGKPNRVISEILVISPRTVNKHLEQIFEKLGVETRAAAAAFAVRVIAH